MMTLDEAIQHTEEIAEEYSYGVKDAWCIKCGEEHKQLAEWLKELKQYRELYGRLKPKETKNPRKRSWKVLSNYGSMSYWRVQCPKCKKLFQMPRDWGPWKGCPICWEELNFNDPYTKEKKDKRDEKE